MVTANEGMSVKVGTGRAWFNGTWTRNDAPYILNLEPSNLLLKRIDAVVLEVNASDDVRENSLKIITGTPSSEPVKPNLVRTDKVNQYPLAYISVGIGAVEISQADILNSVGLTPCPFVTGILETMDIDALVAQWESQWENWMADMTQSAEEFKSNQESSFVEWSTQRRTEFDEWLIQTQSDFDYWLNNVKGTLEGDVAGNLAVQISDANIKITDLQNNKVDKPVFVETVLEVSKWNTSSKTYSFEAEYPSDQYDISIQPNYTATKEQVEAYGLAMLTGRIGENIITAKGDVPVENIPIILKVVTK